MQAISDIPRAKERKQTTNEVLCYHCGTPCLTTAITKDDKVFCCDGCRLVYEIIDENGLCDYYKIQNHPGLTQVKNINSDKYAWLDNEEIASQLYQFTDGDQTMVTLYLPGIHCSSCLWLLEHMNRLHEGISDSRVNFSAKEITIRFSRKKISLRRIASLLTTIGYEPYISMDNATGKKAKTYNKQKIFRLGVAGFCFGNIMMLSFPEYLSSATGIDEQYTGVFRYLNLGLAMPVFFYSANEFFSTAWKGLQQKTLNIDLPVALAIVITFVRSIWEILSGTGAGYLDSMSGIVFFMLVGRVVQERTYKSLSFTRDYKSYFPIAVNVVTPNGVEARKLQDLQKDDVVQLGNDEIVPADGILIDGTAQIDYSFVTGESAPVLVKKKELVYAGGRQTGHQIQVQIVKPVAGSYLTSLWNHYAFSRNKAEENDRESVIHVLSRYFTIILFTLAAGTAAYWYYHDPSKIIVSVSAMLIVACPCALLLTATFTNGNVLRLMANNGLFLRDAAVIEQLGEIDHIVFDKTGTLTQGGNDAVVCTGHQLTEEEKDLLYATVSVSRHPNSRALTAWLGVRNQPALSYWQETAGAGIAAMAGTTRVLVGSAAFAGADDTAQSSGGTVFVRIGTHLSVFQLKPLFREAVPGVLAQLAGKFKLALLSGDNDRQRPALEQLFGQDNQLLFHQKPEDKLRFVQGLQATGGRVAMIGDGLNDAGALQQSNVGITVAGDINNFTPSCDAILDAGQLQHLPKVLRLARAARQVIHLSFAVSIVYNMIGLWFAMRGELTPVAAAILMPCSTLSIVIVTTGVSSLLAWRYGLTLTSRQ
jgi:Cu+-exporting ATPase